MRQPSPSPSSAVASSSVEGGGRAAAIGPGAVSPRGAGREGGGRRSSRASSVSPHPFSSDQTTVQTPNPPGRGGSPERRRSTRSGSAISAQWISCRTGSTYSVASIFGLQHQSTSGTVSKGRSVISMADSRSVLELLNASRERRLTCAECSRRGILTVECQAFILLIIAADIAWTAVAAFALEEAAPMSYIIATSTTVVYATEVALLLFGLGWRNFVRTWSNLADVLMVVAAFLLSLARPLRLMVDVKCSDDFEECISSWRFLGFCSRCMLLLIHLLKWPQVLRRSVSRNKYRFLDLERNFDLDLTYIRPDLIAFSAPVEHGCQAIYRNPLSDVARFLQEFHSNRFRVYNACPELPYSDAAYVKAGGTMVRYNIMDHTPPTMDNFIDFLTDAHKWYNTGNNNVIAVHCKAGKGRTGSFCCAWLMYSRAVPSPKLALEAFASQRTDHHMRGQLRGVETPSQVRSVYQLWEHMKRTESWFLSPQLPVPVQKPKITLQGLLLEEGLFADARRMKPLKAMVQCLAAEDGCGVMETEPVEHPVKFLNLSGMTVQGDVRISIFQQLDSGFSALEAMRQVKNFTQAKGLVLFFQFHTAFMKLDMRGKLERLQADRQTAGSLETPALEVPGLGALSPRLGRRHSASSPRLGDGGLSPGRAGGGAAAGSSSGERLEGSAGTSGSTRDNLESAIRGRDKDAQQPNGFRLTSEEVDIPRQRGPSRVMPGSGLSLSYRMFQEIPIASLASPACRGVMSPPHNTANRQPSLAEASYPLSEQFSSETL